MNGSSSTCLNSCARREALPLPWFAGREHDPPVRRVCTAMPEVGQSVRRSTTMPGRLEMTNCGTGGSAMCSRSSSSAAWRSAIEWASLQVIAAVRQQRPQDRDGVDVGIDVPSAW